MVFNDSKIVVLYSNGLLENPPEPILQSLDERANKCIHGPAKTSRWKGTDMLYHTDFFVPAPIVAYNMFMNGVDCMDQLRATLAKKHKEKCLHMTIFTFLLDLAVMQAYSINQNIKKDMGEKISFFHLKHKICES